MLSRIAIFVLAALLAAPPAAVAGEKCIQRPRPEFIDEELDVHPNGDWHDDAGPAGKLSPAAMKRFRAFQRSGASKRKVTRCLEALIKNEGSRTAKRLCKVRKRQVF